MSSPEIRALGIVQDSYTMRWRARGEVEGVGWLEAWGSTLVEAMEALQAEARRVTAAQRLPEEES
jgi:hypothetical protein